MNWIDAKETTPPFNKYILVKLHGRITSCRVVEYSPNDDKPGSEFYELCQHECSYHDFQFYLQSIDNKWMGNIDVDLHGDSDFMDDFSDGISHWCDLEEVY